MSQTITSKFTEAFDPASASHVVWLGKFFTFAETLGSKRNNIDDFINTNPMGIKVKQEEMLEWVQIHFMLGMKYAQAVLKQQAYIPPSSTSSKS